MKELYGMLPLPKLAFFGGSFTKIESVSGDFEDAAAVFADAVSKVFGAELSEGEDVYFAYDESLLSDEYTINVTSDGVFINAGGEYGASYAAASLLQMMEMAEGGLKAPTSSIHDRPDCNYRGVMIDCARLHHPMSLIKRYVDMCWFYKIKYLHLHLTDDQAYTLPCSVLDGITSEHNSYSADEIAELVEYAKARAVQIVPEVDTPGHSKILREKHPEIFGEKNIIRMSEEVIGTMKAIYSEVCDMFPYSEYIHIGADESSIMDWNECEESIAYGLRHGIDIKDLGKDGSEYWRRAESLYVNYVNNMADAVIAKGRKPVMWEDLDKQFNHAVNKEITIMQFENLYQLPATEIKSAFKIINCSWRPTYIVTPKWMWPKDECYKWNIGTFSAVHPDSPYYNGVYVMEDTTGIEGGQINAWGDFMAETENALEAEFDNVLHRAGALAENTWNREKRDDYARFLCRDERCEKIYRKMIENE